MEHYKDAEFNFPILRSGEWNFIREKAGITFKQIAEYAGKRSRSTPYHWLVANNFMKPYQTKILMEMMDKELWEDCRNLYKVDPGIR